MDGSSLNVAAPVFQPGGGSAPTARQPSPLQMPPSVSGLGTPLQDRNGPPSQAFQPAMLSQIQNQMTPGGGVPGGMVHMNANSRPFIPGGAPPAIFKPQTPTTPYHSASPSITNPSRSPLPAHRLGHGMNPASVQLTGLPAFLATPPIMTNLPHSTGFAGPPSPLSPNASVPPSPFMLPQGQPNLGLPYPGGLMNGAGIKFRKGKGPQPVTPLKTTGHNSTPSISMNPAAFAASLAALKAKKKVVVSVPNEQPLPEDEAILAQSQDELGKEADAEATDASKAEAAKRRHARAAALTRQKWVQRQPWESTQHDLVPCIEVPEDAIVTCEIHPEPWPHSRGLPDTIDIYLPGMSAWDEYREMRLEEQQMEAQAAEQDLFLPLVRPKPLLPSEFAAFNADHKGRSLSISTPADPSMVSFKLNRFLQSQQLSRDDPNRPIDDEQAKSLQDANKPFGRFQTDLPNRLREAFARRRGESTDLHLRPPLKHSHTMSLGLPSSGGPFGPEVFSALDMIRANSDEGPSKPPLEAQDLPEKPSSDSEAMIGRAEPFLANIAEDDGEQEAELAESAFDGAKGTESGSWKDLGRGFGYDPEPQAERGASKRHARQASRISVSTSRRGGEASDGEILSEGDELEIRTNPSEDADASDFEDEIDEYGPEHWHARRGSAHFSAFGDAHHRHGYDDMSDDDSLRDSLTPSDEQFSNPSDEEAAREERIFRRQHRAAERAARRERKLRQRGRANTDNTLPSSSIGEADIHDHGRFDYEQRQRSHQDEIISNPSDEVQSDVDDSQTFGHADRPRRADDGPRLSQDFRFPPPKPVTIHNSPARQGNGPPMSGTLGRSSGISMLNPGAKEFKFGGASAATRAVSAPVSSVKDTQEGTAGHFRLPSIKTSSFGSSALGDVPANAPHLNVGAPSFTPGAFTFKAPVRLQVPESVRIASPDGAATGFDGNAGEQDAENREMQGREKRTRYGPIDYNSDDERYAAYSTSPPRPKASAASIEGPLRSFSTLARQGPPPFLPPGFGQQQRAVSHDSRFTVDAPSFVPTWAKSGQHFGGSTSFKRPTLPDWSQPQDAQQEAEEKSLPSIRDPSFFSRETGSKAIPIRRPSENDEAEGLSQSDSQKRGLSSGHNFALLDELSVGSAADSSAVSPQDVGAHAVGLDAGQTSTETLMAPTRWAGPSRPESAWPAERARPMHIPVGPHSYQSSAASLASDAGAGPSVRWGDRRASSSIGMSSVDRRLRRGDRNHHRSARDAHGDDDEDEDESLTDFVEEIADRVDKALEGWAGKILDEVTIMGQVRPVLRNGNTHPENSVDQDRIVQEISRRMEEALDVHLSSTFSAHVRKSTDASDETQTTIRPVRQRTSSPDEKMAVSGLVDAPGEWDFDYVQDILDVKLGEFSKQIESTMAQVVEKLDAHTHNNVAAAVQDREREGAMRASLPSDFVESVTSRLTAQLGSLFESHTSSAKELQSAAESKLQQAVQNKLDENLFLLSEKGAADRSNIQHMLESEMHGLERSIHEVGNSVKDHLQSALNECLPPLLEEKATHDTTLADRLTNQLGQALGPVLSEERRCLLEDNQRSRDLLLEALPSSSQIAQSTVKLVEPLIQGLKTDPIDSDALVTRLAEVIGKQSIEHMVDLNPVLALLEPLIAKQEDARSFSKKILQRQEDTERTLSELPGAINAKTEIFLSSASDQSEKQRLILDNIAEIRSELERKGSLSAVVSSIDTEMLHNKLEDLSQDREVTRETAEKTLSELAAVYQVLTSSYEALSRLETQYTSSEQVHQEVMVKLEKQAQDGAEMARELREAEARAARVEVEKAEVVAQLSSSNKENTMLRDQLAQMTAELASLKAERTQDREASAKALSEATARADRAETASAGTHDRMSRLLDQATVAEREAYESAKTVLERASKAEGQLLALEKRIAEQDVKIANLQQLSATQKQKAAQSHQKLAEGEKRVKELEAQAKGLEVARKRIEVLEGVEGELEGTRVKLKESEEREVGLREEIGRYDERFAEMERELLGIKEGYVEVSTHQATVLQLEESQKLIQQLQAQLESQHNPSDGWESVEKPRATGAWASMHAPRLRINDEDEGEEEEEEEEEIGDSSADLVRGVRSVSFASTASSKGRGRDVEVDEGGWWS
ncbi:related to transport protein USO1 [Ustilago trichophora]|uniref:Related to transport protein USO1 n=1 Tax=Ustilago trichophora TaxID=86804 RepID=A0A5C3EHF1_9BASI|nr:related to transport protein USO1 [Ustilago trichophora]